MKETGWRIELIQPPAHLPVRRRPEPRTVATVVPAPARPEGALIAACELLARRGSGPGAWVTPFRNHPIAFLLDAIGDVVNLWGPDGRIVFRNHASEQLHLDAGPPQGAARELVVIQDRRFERRCERVTHGGSAYVLEVLREARE